MSKGSFQQEDTKLLNLDVFYNTAHKYIRQKKGANLQGETEKSTITKEIFLTYTSQ